MADFAVGCTYKYLNGGPGAPAFIWVNPRHADVARPILQGWMGHEAPFAFTPDYAPAPGIERMRVGTPPVIAMAALEAALDVWDEVSMDHLRAKSVDLTGAFIAEVEASCPDLLLNSPRSRGGYPKLPCSRPARVSGGVPAPALGFPSRTDLKLQ